MKNQLVSEACDRLGVRFQCHHCRGWFLPCGLVADHFPALAEGGTPNGVVLSCRRCDRTRADATQARANGVRPAKWNRKGRKD